jgi:O-antigen/teichoic acid export membrane protein
MTAADSNAAGTGVETPRKAGVGVTIARNSIWLLVDTVAGMVVSFYSSILVARRLGPDFMGQYNYILWFAFVLRMFTEVAIPATVRKFAAELMGRQDYVALKTLVRRAMWLQAKLATVGVAFGIGFVFLSFPADQRGFGTLAVLTIVPSLFLSIPTGALWATEDLRSSVIASLVATAVNAIGVTAAVFLNWGLVGLVGSLLVSRTVDFALRFDMFRKEYARLPGAAGTHLDPTLRKRMVPFAAQQMVLTFLFAMMFDRMEVFFLKAFSTSREIAFFSISFTLVQYLQLFPKQLSGSAGASMMVKQGRSSGEAARIAATATWFMMLLSAPGLFGVAALSDPVLRVVYGTKYLPAIPVLAVLSLFGLALAASQPAQYLLVAAERQMFYIAWLLVSCLVDVIGNVVLDPGFGALGAAYAKGLSQVIAGGGFLIYMVWQFKVSLPVARMARLLLACTVMFFAVRLVSRPLPALAGVCVGIPVGVAMFALAARVLRCLDRTDRDRLRQLDRLFPSRARRAYLGLVHFLVPA